MKEENKFLMSEQDSLKDNLGELNGQMEQIDTAIKKKLTFIDLKQERDKKAAPPPLSEQKLINDDNSLNTDKIKNDLKQLEKEAQLKKMAFNKKVNDYSEKVEDDTEQVEEEGENKKKKKKRKKKKKSAANENTEADQ